jgi:hypothetical protein
MKATRLPRVPILAPLLHLTLVVGGLVATTLLRPHGTEWCAFLWGGALIGTALGQIFATARLRPWLVAVIMMSVLWFGAVLMAPFGWPTSGGVEVALMAFLPALVCGYASLSERGAVVAFWFPAVLFMLPILEGAPSSLDATTVSLLGADGTWLLLTALSGLFLAFLRARETRRVAVWQRSASVRMSLPKPSTVLKRAPLRSLSQWGFVAATGAAALTITSLVAPYLWQKEELPGEKAIEHAQSASEAPVAAPVWNGTEWTAEGTTQAVCCPDMAPARAETQDRYREYFPVHPTPHDDFAAPVQPAGCVVCGHAGTPATTLATGPSLASGLAPPYAPPPSPVNGNPYATSPTGTPTSTGTPTPNVTPTPAPAPVKPPHATPNPYATPTPTEIAPNETPELHGGIAFRGPRAGLSGRPEEQHPIRWLLTGVACILGIELLLRPFRRLLTLRHLKSPLWSETVDQRVSNLWQLALVGLRDAGICATTGEQPEELARRAGVPGMESCATVLERARHGVRVDAVDLDVMTREATAAYNEARKRVGSVPRAASWLRWPLV